MSRRKKSTVSAPPVSGAASAQISDANQSTDASRPTAGASPGASVSTQLAQRKRLFIGSSLVLGMVLIVWLGGWLVSRRASAQVELARRMLQIERPRLAIEALARDDSAEAHYLKAVALQAIGQHTAARDQISEAISIAPYEVKYQGYQLLLGVSAGKQEAIDELIRLYESGNSAPGIAFFATNAFTKKKPPDIRGALLAFDLGITLIDETPEFMSNAMHFAINTLRQADEGGDEQLYQQKVAAAERLLEKIEQVAPSDPILLKELLTWAVKGKLVATSQRLLQRITELNADSAELTELKIKVDLMLGQSESAIRAAKEAITENPGDPNLDLMLAEATWQASPNAEREKILTDLAARHPENPEFVAKLALYLAKAKRLPDAVNAVNQAIAKSKSAEARASLLKLAVGLPLEAANAELSEQQVAKFKNEFHNTKIIEYFEGRVLFLKKDFAGAKQKFQKVLSELQITNESDRLLATECLVWQQKILKWELANAKRDAVNEALKIKSAVEEQSSTNKSKDSAKPQAVEPSKSPEKPAIEDKSESPVKNEAPAKNEML